MMVSQEIIDHIICHTTYDLAIKLGNKYAIQYFEQLKKYIKEDGMRLTTHPHYKDAYIYTLMKIDHYDFYTDYPLVFPEINKENLININMMPFELFQKESIPDEYQGYWKYINACIANIKKTDQNRIAYLTIQESYVKKGETQRRTGLHVDASKDTKFNEYNQIHVSGAIHWGGGITGGIFLASNIPESFKAWKCSIDDAGIGQLGDISAFRSILPKKTIKNEANVIYKITDHTPHEALPMKEDGYRQFFRLVVGKVDVWYDKHSTTNRLGIVPESYTKIVSYNKFENKM